MKRSLVTSLRLAFEVPDEDPDQPDRWLMITTTYRPGLDWEPCHISNMLRHYRRELAQTGDKLVYAWVLEMQKRGAPHYHVAIRAPRGRKLSMPDAAGYWPHGSTRIEWARNPVGYMAKYLSKLNEIDHYPKGARISGFGGLTPEAKRERRYWAAPSYIREQFGECCNPFRRAGGGWIDRETGEVLPARYQCVGRGAGRVRLVDTWGGDQPPEWISR